MHALTDMRNGDRLFVIDQRVKVSHDEPTPSEAANDTRPRRHEGQVRQRYEWHEMAGKSDQGPQ
jgi:hypothetical protein